MLEAMHESIAGVLGDNLPPCERVELHACKIAVPTIGRRGSCLQITCGRPSIASYGGYWLCAQHAQELGYTEAER